MISFFAICALALAQQPATDHLAWFREARLGMFIHWGPVSLKGTEIGWSRGDGVPIEEYDQLYRRFNPTRFNADEWMNLAKRAGFNMWCQRKHHEVSAVALKRNFLHISATPFHRDIMGELSQAAKKNGIAMCSYYSILDWHSPSTAWEVREGVP